MIPVAKQMRQRMRWRSCLYLLAVLVAAITPGLIAQTQPNGQPPDNSASAPPAKQDSSIPTRVRMGGDIAAKGLIDNVEPVYPDDAKAQRVEGTVLLHVLIAKDGSVQKIDVVSGPDLLVPAATDAVKQWRYKPVTIHGQAVEVETEIAVVFNLISPSSPPPNT